MAPTLKIKTTLTEFAALMGNKTRSLYTSRKASFISTVVMHRQAEYWEKILRLRICASTSLANALKVSISEELLKLSKESMWAQLATPRTLPLEPTSDSEELLEHLLDAALVDNEQLNVQVAIWEAHCL